MKNKQHSQSIRICLSLLAVGLGPQSHAEELLFTLAPSSDHLELGSAFTMAGDLNADGVNDIAISDRSAKVGGFIGSGIVHIVSGVDGSPLRDYAGVPASSQSFGSAFATLDADGDGVLDLAVGSPGQANIVGFGAGAVRVYSGADGSLLSTAAGTTGSQLGTSLANAGDQNSDGVDDLYAGAPNANSSLGAVFVISGADGTLLRTIPAPTSVSSFGLTLATLGDVDDDGRPDLAVGAPGFRAGPNPVGRVALIRSSDGAAAAEIIGTKVYNRLGESLAVTPDLSGDGIPDLMVGSYSGGTALLLSGADFKMLKDLSIPTLPAYRQLTVGGSLDFDGDGTFDFLLGSPALQTVSNTLVGGIRVVSGTDQASMFELTAGAAYTGLGLRLVALPGLGFAVGETNLKDLLTNGWGFAKVWKVISDSDGDGFPDNIDSVPQSIMTPTVMILGVDSNVINTLNGEGMTLADRIAELGDLSSYKTPALYQVELIHLASGLVESGLLTRDEWKQLQAAVVQALKPARNSK